LQGNVDEMYCTALSDLQVQRGNGGWPHCRTF
jgi:hypothetical protein